MWAKTHQNVVKLSIVTMLFAVLASIILPFKIDAITPLPTPGPQGGSYGLEASKTQPAPTQAATITTPSSGGSFSTSPITVSGLCFGDLLVQVYDNGVLVGAINCVGGSFSLQITLFTGQNDLTATLFDDLYQSGPDSNKVTVTYNNSDFTAFGALVTLTSNFGRRAADPGATLSWPLLLSGGSGPYAFSIDWGDGKPAELKSVLLSGEVDIAHVYDKAGIYHVTVKVTDVNGVSAFLQLVAISNGKPTNTVAGTDKNKNIVYVTRVVWIPAAVSLVLLPLAYWLGRRSELVSLHKKLEKDIASYKEL